MGLAVWGALLKSNGYQVKEEDRPLLAAARYLKSDGQEANPEEIQNLRQQAQQNLAKFPGRTRKIDKRVYIHFEDYCNWLGCKVKGDLKSQVNAGIITASWNQWVQDQGGDNAATIRDLPVKPLYYTVDEQDYYACHSGIEEAIKRRNDIVEDARHWRYNQEKKGQLFKDWKTVFENHLTELYGYRQSINSIRQNYFDSQPILFPDLNQDLGEIITDTEELASIFNEVFTDLFQLSERIDLEAIRQSARQRAKARMAYIVDMAKAEALDSLGESGEGVKLVERYV